MSENALTIYELLRAQAARASEAVAILAPERAPLTYQRLYQHIQDVIGQLSGLGLGRNDRVAIAMPNGPEMAVAFLSVAAAATCAPLNPAYRQSEFDFYLSDLRAKALIVLAGIESPARDVANYHRIPTIDLELQATGAAGLFTLSGKPQPLAASGGVIQPEDVALVLHTSGTTSRPKMVPLTQQNLCSSVANICRTLELSSADRCLNIMPLFHIHGLVGAVLASIASGSSIVCSPGFDASSFFDWLTAYRPSWYTAVPTMHQAILKEALAHSEVVSKHRLRFIRSSSAALPPQVMAELERTFGVPVIESYGMTEASHQMCSSPLPPGERKPGSVGLPAGPEVAIMDETGRLLPPNELGEIVIRGPSVMTGYANNPAADEVSFSNGWFRTGDQGRIDEDGYVFITGRLKEMINRGGEKISPREVDEVLLDHPAVRQAVTFAVPHAQLGEDIAAAVVLGDVSATEQEIRQFALNRLADFKVPSRVVFVDQIPKGPTGKLQRIGLHEKLADQLKVEFEAPRNAVEETLAQIWCRVLEVNQVGVHDDFFQLGGFSLPAVRMFVEIEKSFGRSLPVTNIFSAPTIKQLAAVLEATAAPVPSGCIVVLQEKGTGAPLFCMSRGALFDLRQLAHHLGDDQPVYGLQYPGSDGRGEPLETIEEIAAEFISHMRMVQPQGPYQLCGLCLGGLVAYEIAQQLIHQEQPVALLAMVDTFVPGFGRPRRKDRPPWDGNQSAKLVSWMHKVRETNRRAARCYRPQPYPGRLILFQPTKRKWEADPLNGWGPLITGGIETHLLDGSHGQMFREPVIRVLASDMRSCLLEASRRDRDLTFHNGIYASATANAGDNSQSS